MDRTSGETFLIASIWCMAIRRQSAISSVDECSVAERRPKLNADAEVPVGALHVKVKPGPRSLGAASLPRFPHDALVGAHDQLAMSPAMLPVLPLQRPLLVLPSARLTLPVSKAVAELLLGLLHDSDAHPILAAVPALPTPTNVGPDAGIDLAEHGTAARVVRIARAPARNAALPYLLSLQGVARIRLLAPPKRHTPSLDRISYHPVEYLTPRAPPSADVVDAFRAAALTLLDRLAKDASQPFRRDGWLKLVEMIDDMSEARALGIADLLVAAVTGDYDDQLGA